MTRMFLVRHGRTVWNKEQIFRGTYDIPLDEVGKQEARLVGEWLQQEEIEAVYSSPLSRARETAKAIALLHGLEVTVVDELTDLDFGQWQGMSLREVRNQYPDPYRTWDEEPHRLVFPGGEGLDAVRSRVLEATSHIVASHPEGTVVLVSHRVVLKVLICALLGLDNSHFWHIGQDTAAINRFDFKNGRWIVSLLNDICHLKALDEQRAKVDF